MNLSAIVLRSLRRDPRRTVFAITTVALVTVVSVVGGAVVDAVLAGEAHVSSIATLPAAPGFLGVGADGARVWVPVTIGTAEAAALDRVTPNTHVTEPAARTAENRPGIWVAGHLVQDGIVAIGDRVVLARPHRSPDEVLRVVGTLPLGRGAPWSVVLEGAPNDHESPAATGDPGIFADSRRPAKRVSGGHAFLVLVRGIIVALALLSATAPTTTVRVAFESRRAEFRRLLSLGFPLWWIRLSYLAEATVLCAAAVGLGIVLGGVALAFVDGVRIAAALPPGAVSVYDGVVSPTAEVWGLIRDGAIVFVPTVVMTLLGAGGGVVRDRRA